MTRATVSALWRHPIKSHGREALESVELVKGQTMPWDRHWAVTHDKTKFSAAEPEWVMCRNFVIGNLAPRVAGTWAKLDEATGEITLTHDDLGEITFRPDDPADVTRFIDWVAPLSEGLSQHPTALVSVPDRGMTDTVFPSISVMSTASHRAVEGRLGRALEPERWRGNIWLDGLDAWEEFEWMDKTLRIGTVELIVLDRIQRCKHTMANPTTGRRDVPTLDVLQEAWGHEDFGIYAEVTKGGRIAVGDTAEVQI